MENLMRALCPSIIVCSEYLCMESYWGMICKIKSIELCYYVWDEDRIMVGIGFPVGFVIFWVNLNWRSLQTIALVFCWNAAALPSESNGYIRVDCYGGLNQMRRDVSASVNFVITTLRSMRKMLNFNIGLIKKFIINDECSCVMVLVLPAC